jgi:NAD(P)-dependent dehydrogenase (short-subunit alcohol dehydrogenase family)
VKAIEITEQDSADVLRLVYSPDPVPGPGQVLIRVETAAVITSETFWEPPPPKLLPYVASKGAVVGITRSLAREFGPDGVAVTAVAPGLTDTPASRRFNTEADFGAQVERQALNQGLVPADTAASVAFLVFDGAAVLTGQVLCADGGLVLH